MLPLHSTLCLLCCFVASFAVAEVGYGFETLLLDGNHRFSAGDDPAWASPDFDDSQWHAIQVPGSADSQGLDRIDGMGWYRIYFDLPSTSVEMSLAVDLGVVWGADEAFLNGVRIGGAGKLGVRPVFPYNVRRVYSLPKAALEHARPNVLALRIQNGYDVWGLVNGPVRIGERRLLAHDQALHDRFYSGVDAALILGAALAVAAWLLFWFSQPLDRVLIFTGAGVLGLLYVTIVASLPFWHTGLLGPWLYTAIMPVQTSALLLTVIGAILFVSDRRYRAFDLLPLSCVLVGAGWMASPNLRVQATLSNIWLGLCFGLALLLATEIVRAVWRGSQDGLVMFFCAGIALGTGCLGLYWGHQANPADWTMRYAIVLSLWAIPLFTLSGLAARLLRTRQQLLLLSGQVLSAGSEERRRLSRELHDGVAQNLQAANLTLQRASLGVTVDRGAVKGAMELVADTIQELRVLAQDLRPAATGPQSLEHSLANYCEILSVRTAVQVIFEDLRDESLELAPAVAEHLYRIAQEAIGNAIRHGKASRVNVELRGGRLGLWLCVDDNGSGFDPSLREQTVEGIGLSTMKERAALIGGSCEVISTRNGTQLKVHISGRMIRELWREEH